MMGAALVPVEEEVLDGAQRLAAKGEAAQTLPAFLEKERPPAMDAQEPQFVGLNRSLSESAQRAT